MLKLHGCWLLYFGTALARNLEDCQIFDMYSNNILDLLGLTNLGTKCEDVVCKLKLQFHFAFCILHFTSCISQNLPVAKTYFSKRIHKVELQSWYVGKSQIRVHTSHGLLSTCLSNAWSRMIEDLCKFNPPRCILARTFVERALCVSKVYPY